MNAEKKDLEAGAEAPLPQPGLGEADADRRAASATPPSEKRDEEPVKDPNLVRGTTTLCPYCPIVLYQRGQADGLRR